jgi:hypothetical protein
MSTAFRVYYLEDSGDWARFPAKRYWDFYTGQRPIPEFAGKTIRFVTLAVELVDRRPHEVLQHWPSVARIDDSGFEPKQDKELAFRGGGTKARRAMAGWMGNDAKANVRSESNLVDARDRFLIKAYEDQLVWEPNPRQLEALYDAVLSEKRGFSKKPVR